MCQSSDPRDRRSRTSALVESNGSALLIDTPPELRLQVLRAGVRHLDAVLYTHEHADHVHGIDDLRSFSLLNHAPLPLYGPASTISHLHDSFRYIFDPEVVPPPGTSKPSLTLTPLAPDVTATIAGMPVVPLAFEHGSMTVFGYRIGKLGYVTDVKRVGPTAAQQLAGIDVLVLNALWWRAHPTHLSIDEAIGTARTIGARRTVLTHLTHETGHQELLDRLPPGVEPGYDGLTVEIDR
ncbi:MAG: MBL fold metallo-hydrolase [Gemmatimonadaceae bacterium]